MARPMTKDCSIFFFDCETGGLHSWDADMVEVAVVLTDPTGKDVREEYSARVFPVRPVQTKAAEVNGYTAEKWAETAVQLDGVMHRLIKLSRNAVFAAHNASFDWAFFEAAMQPRGMRWDGNYHKFDTVALSMPLVKLGLLTDVKLQTLAAHFEIDPGEPHRALSDARTCRQVYLRLMELWEKAILPAKGLE